ncbi:MAG: HlyC/CorC family transporter [Phycisphaerae bacterium]|nr:HlyC/CorC family transporter [Phycisphaerae bacterium]
MLALFLYFFLALFASFLCSLLEAVILCVSPAYINIIAQTKPASGKLLKSLKSNIDRPLSAILTLNTVAHTIGAAGVGACVADIWDKKYLAVASAILTVLILVFSEIIPKTLGAVYWKKLAPVSAYIIMGLIKILYPVVLALEFISNKLSNGHSHHIVSREEMMATADIGHHTGTLEVHETQVIKNLLGLQSIRVKDILTPRSVLVAFQEDMTIDEIVENNSPIRFSRIPVYGKDLDDIKGFVLRYQVLQAYSKDQGFNKLSTLAKEIHAIPETKNVADTMSELIKMRQQLFLVVDEYGGTAGIITLEDAVETLLGVEIVDEFDTVEDMRKYALQQWEKRKNMRE